VKQAVVKYFIIQSRFGGRERRDETNVVGCRVGSTGGALRSSG
jgi:hypothetical protein